MTSTMLTVNLQMTQARSACEVEKAAVVIPVDIRERRSVKENGTEIEKLNTLIKNRYLLVRERDGRKGNSATF